MEEIDVVEPYEIATVSAATIGFLVGFTVGVIFAILYMRGAI